MGIIITIALIVIFIAIIKTNSPPVLKANDVALENQKAAERREKIIRDFGKFIEDNSQSHSLLKIHDVSVLPYPKEEILYAFLLEIARGHSQKMNDVLEMGPIFLAQYQPDVGSEPIVRPGMSVLSLPKTDDMEELRNQARLVAEKDKIMGPRFEQFNKLVEADLKHIKALVSAAKTLEEKMPEEQKKRVLGGQC